MKKLFFALALLTLPLVSCNRYEEGSNFSFLTAKARAVGEWIVTDISTNGQNVTSNFPNVRVSIKDDNTYTIQFSLLGFPISEENGTWAFNADKTRFLMTSTVGNLSDRKIVMLKNKMMKLEEINAATNATTVWTLEQ